MRLTTKVDAGELKEFVEISERVEGIDSNGFNASTYKTLIKTRCKSKTLKTREFLNMGVSDIKASYKLIVRRRRDFTITDHHYATFRNRLFNIFGVDELDEFYVEILLKDFDH